MSLLDHLESEADLDACLSAPSAADIDLLHGVSTATCWCSARRARWGHRSCCVSCARWRPRAYAASRHRCVSILDALVTTGARRRRCDHLLPWISSMRRASTSLPDSASVLFLAGTQVRFDRQHLAHMGHQHDRARQHRPPFSPISRIVAFLDRERLSVRARDHREAASRAMRPRRAASTRNRVWAASAFSGTTRAQHGTPTLLFRLNYAVDLRYGVLVDIARAVKSRPPSRSNRQPLQCHLAGRRQLVCAARARRVRIAAARAQRHRCRSPVGDRRRRLLRSAI